MAIATIVMAVATGVIACTNRKQLNAQIFIERYRVYKQINDYVTSDRQPASWKKQSDDEIKEIHKSEYLIPQETSKFIFEDDIFKHLEKYNQLVLDAKLPASNYEVTTIEGQTPPSKFEELQKIIKDGTFKKPFLKYLKKYPK